MYLDGRLPLDMAPQTFPQKLVHRQLKISNTRQVDKRCIRTFWPQKRLNCLHTEIKSMDEKMGNNQTPSRAYKSPRPAFSQLAQAESLNVAMI